MNPSINLADWHDVLQDALYWEELNPDKVILYFKYANRAHAEGCQYYVNHPAGRQPVELTKILEQFIILEKLRADYYD